MIWAPLFDQFSVYTALVFFTLYALICCFLCRLVGWHTLRAFSIGIILLVLRFLIPLEYPGVKLIKLSGWYADFWVWLNPKLAEGITPLKVFLAVWAAGTVLGLLHLGFRLYRQHREIRKNTAAPTDRVFRIYRDVLQELSCTTVGSVSISAGYHSPMMAGFLNPHILLPADIAEASDGQLQLIFRHEIIHFKNRDLWIKLAAKLLCCALWWNPVVYLLHTCISQLLELRCDSLVCRDLDQQEQLDYSQTLLNSFTKPLHPRAYVTAEYWGYPNKERLKQRFKQILYAPSQAKKRALSVLIVSLAIVAFLGSYTVTILPTDLPEGLGNGMELDTTLESSLILRLPDGTLQVYIENQLYATIDESQLSEEPFCNMPVFDASFSAE